MAETKFYSLVECAKLFNCSYRSVFNYIKEGKVKAIKIGHYWKVSQEEVDYVLANGTRQKPELEFTDIDENNFLG